LTLKINKIRLLIHIKKKLDNFNSTNMLSICKCYLYVLMVVYAYLTELIHVYLCNKYSIIIWQLFIFFLVYFHLKRKHKLLDNMNQVRVNNNVLPYCICIVLIYSFQLIPFISNSTSCILVILLMELNILVERIIKFHIKYIDYLSLEIEYSS